MMTKLFLEACTQSSSSKFAMHPCIGIKNPRCGMPNAANKFPRAVSSQLLRRFSCAASAAAEQAPADGQAVGMPGNSQIPHHSVFTDDTDQAASAAAHSLDGTGRGEGQLQQLGTPAPSSSSEGAAAAFWRGATLSTEEAVPAAAAAFEDVELPAGLPRAWDFFLKALHDIGHFKGNSISRCVRACERAWVHHEWCQRDVRCAPQQCLIPHTRAVTHLSRQPTPCFSTL